MPDVKTVKGLTDEGRALVESIFSGNPMQLSEPNYHPDVEGCWFLVFDHTYEEVVVVDSRTTVGYLSRILGK